MALQSFAAFVQPLHECVGLSLTVDGRIILAKNRDRAYKPALRLVHELSEGTEIAYLLDDDTDWSEGMNEHGIGIVNTALMVGYDEREHIVVKKGAKPSKDGARIRHALTFRTIDDVVKAVTTYNGGVKGHTIVSSADACYTIEVTSRHTPHIEKHQAGVSLVRTNHGMKYPDAGYSQDHKPNDYRSSIVRKRDTERVIKNAKTWEDVLPLLRQQPYAPDSNYNMRRSTEKMFTSSQLVMNLTDKYIELHVFSDKIKATATVDSRLPSSFPAKITTRLVHLTDVS